MTMLCLQIPDDAYNALKLPPGRVEEELRHEFAVYLVKDGLLGQAQARTIAKMDRLAFQALLARRNVEWGGSPEEALHDLETAHAAVQSDPV